MESLLEYQGFTSYEAKSINQSSATILKNMAEEISRQFHREE